MCIVIVTTTHPDYPLILLNNRDEFLHRPTASAGWWDPPFSYVLGGRDLHRAEHGTWLGITKQGRMACLTNFREEDQTIVEGRRSRGGIVNAFLKTPPQSEETTEEAAEKLIQDGVSGVGGFSLLFGRVERDWVKDREMAEKKGRTGLAIVSNRSTDLHSVKWLCSERNETHALSNSHYGDMSWPKVVQAEQAVCDAVKLGVAAHETKEALIQRFLDILSHDSLPPREDGEEWDIYLNQLRHSVFVRTIGRKEQKEIDDLKKAHEVMNGLTNGHVDAPIAEATHGVYGTQKQSIILVDKEGRVTFFERTLFDLDGCPIKKGEGDKTFEFQIENW